MEDDVYLESILNNRSLYVANYLNTQARAGSPHVLWDLPVLRWRGLGRVGVFAIFSIRILEMGAGSINNLTPNDAATLRRGNGNWRYWVLL